jgi:hypothetical protein
MKAAHGDDHPRDRRRAARALLAAVCAATLVYGCVAVQDEDDEPLLAPIARTPTPAPATPRPTVADLIIRDLREETGPDPTLVRITGTIVNRGDRDAVRVQVKVEARGPAGRVLTRVNTQAFADVIPPNGASAFDAILPRSTAIHEYHAEIVGR